MNLVILALSLKTIGKLSENDFEEVLFNRHNTIRIKKVNQGIMLLSNNTIIKCVSNYYKNLTDQVKKTKNDNAALHCHYTKENLNLMSLGIETFGCISCHVRCIDKRKSKELKRKKNLDFW